MDPNAPGINEAKRRQAAAESLIRKLGRGDDELSITLGSMLLWEPLYNVDDCGELRRFGADGIRDQLERFKQLPSAMLTDDEQALIRDLDAVIERYPEG